MILKKDKELMYGLMEMNMMGLGGIIDSKEVALLNIIRFFFINKKCIFEVVI